MDTDDTSTPGADDPTTDSDQGGDAARTFTQEEVNRLLSRTRSEGARAKARELADELGMTLDEAKAMLSQSKARAEADMSETQRARADADAARAEAGRIATEARAAQLRADTTVALLGAAEPLNRDRLTLALRVVMPDLVGNDADEDDAIATAIEKLRTESPEWFQAPNVDPGAPGPRPGTPAPTLPARTGSERPKGGGTHKERAASMFAAHKARNAPPMPNKQ